MLVPVVICWLRVGGIVCSCVLSGHGGPGLLVLEAGDGSEDCPEDRSEDHSGGENSACAGRHSFDVCASCFFGVFFPSLSFVVGGGVRRLAARGVYVCAGGSALWQILGFL